MARSFTSYRFAIFRWQLASFVTPSNWRYAMRRPASLHSFAKPGSCAKRSPLVAHCTAKYPFFLA